MMDLAKFRAEQSEFPAQPREELETDALRIHQIFAKSKKGGEQILEALKKLTRDEDFFDQAADRIQKLRQLPRGCEFLQLKSCQGGLRQRDQNPELTFLEILNWLRGLGRALSRKKAKKKTAIRK